MKKFYLLLLMGFLGIASQAQISVNEKSVPGIILNDFQYRFVDAKNVSWVKLANDHYGAKFIFRESKTEAVYEEGGAWMQSVSEIPFEYLPEDAQKYCRVHHGGSKIRGVNQVSSRSYGILYEVSIVEDLRNFIITFDQHGKNIASPVSFIPEEGVVDKVSPFGITADDLRADAGHISGETRREPRRRCP